MTDFAAIDFEMANKKALDTLDETLPDNAPEYVTFRKEHNLCLELC